MHRLQKTEMSLKYILKYNAYLSKLQYFCLLKFWIMFLKSKNILQKYCMLSLFTNSVMDAGSRWMQLQKEVLLKKTWETSPKCEAKSKVKNKQRSSNVQTVKISREWSDSKNQEQRVKTRISIWDSARLGKVKQVTLKIHSVFTLQIVTGGESPYKLWGTGVRNQIKWINCSPWRPCL